MDVFMNQVWKALKFISDKMRIIGAAMLVAMAGLTCVDVVGRFFRHPVFGSIELMSLMGALAVAMALPDTHAARGHIGVEMFVDKLSTKKRAFVDMCTGVLSFGLIGVITWRMFDYSIKMAESGEVSMNLELPEYAIIFVVACCFVIFTLQTIQSIADSYAKLRAK
jgi:TRAP-type C4-dicarboxylate transport system permease small subunit